MLKKFRGSFGFLDLFLTGFIVTLIIAAAAAWIIAATGGAVLPVLLLWSQILYVLSKIVKKTSMPFFFLVGCVCLMATTGLLVCRGVTVSGGGHRRRPVWFLRQMAVLSAVLLMVFVVKNFGSRVCSILHFVSEWMFFGSIAVACLSGCLMANHGGLLNGRRLWALDWSHYYLDCCVWSLRMLVKEWNTHVYIYIMCVYIFILYI